MANVQFAIPDSIPHADRKDVLIIQATAFILASCIEQKMFASDSHDQIKTLANTIKQALYAEVKW